MSETPKVADNKQVEAQVRQQVGSITSVQRIVANTTNLVNSCDVKGGDAKAVAEIIDWLSSLYTELEKQRVQLENILPKPEAIKQPEPPKTVLEVVSPDKPSQVSEEVKESSVSNPTPSGV